MNFTTEVASVVDSREQLAQIVGAPVVSIAPMAGGTVSAVYHVMTHKGDQLVLKFSEDVNGSRNEAIPLQAWASAGIRTPTIYKHGTVEESVLGYLLMEYLPGQNLFPLMEKGSVDNMKILYDLGCVLAQMHGVTAPGYGDILVDDCGQVRGKVNSLFETLHEPEWTEVITANRLNGDLLANEEAVVYVAARWLDEQRASRDGSYVHNDYRAGNIIYDPRDQQPYAIIDPHPSLGHPYLCLAYALILEEIHGRNDPRHMKQGYEETTEIGEAALHAALFLRSLSLLPRWGSPSHQYGNALRRFYEREKAWVKRNQ